MSDFTERARAEAKSVLSRGLAGGLPRKAVAPYVLAFRAGAEWARRELLAGPTEAEIEAIGWDVARELWELEPHELNVSRTLESRAAARAAIAAFLEARRGSE